MRELCGWSEGATESASEGLGRVKGKAPVSGLGGPGHLLRDWVVYLIGS